jgi:hypothetical protein
MTPGKKSFQGAASSPNPQTVNAQQCSRHKGLMRHTAASLFPIDVRLTSTRLGLDLAGCGRARLCSDTPQAFPSRPCRKLRAKSADLESALFQWVAPHMAR